MDAPWLSSQMCVPHPSDDVALVDDNVRLPEDGPEHQPHRDGRHCERHPEMRFAGRHAQTAKGSKHQFSPRAHTNRHRLAHMSEVANAGLLPKSSHLVSMFASAGPRGPEIRSIRKSIIVRELFTACSLGSAHSASQFGENMAANYQSMKMSGVIEILELADNV